MFRTISLFILFLGSVTYGLTWQPKLENCPNLHTTAVKLKVDLKKPVPDKVVVDLSTMDYYHAKDVCWRAQLATQGKEHLEAVLQAKDFKFIGKDSPLFPCRIFYTFQIKVTTDGTKDDLVAGVNGEWVNDDKTVLPWEKDPEPAETAPGKTWWPGVSKNNAGHLGWRYEPNGLLIDNVSFNCIESAWYYFKPNRKPEESFQFNFKIPDSLAPKLEVVSKSDIDKKTGEIINRTGEARHFEYKPEKGVYEKDKIEGDWTSVRWKRNIATKSGTTYWQELRYSVLSVGIQVETNSPKYLLSFQDAKLEKGPAGIVWMSEKGLEVSTGEAINPSHLKANWLVLLSNDGSPEIPVMIVFQHRPDTLEIRKDGLILRRKAGVGTLGIGRPFGANVLTDTTLLEWTKKKSSVPVSRFRKFANLLAAYAWKCDESFNVSDGGVSIRNQVTFLPWQDDWNTKPTGYAPLPPLISLSVMRGLLDKTCIGEVIDPNIDTKWGPYWLKRGTAFEYKLPLPRMWDYFPLKVEQTEKNKAIYTHLLDVMSQKEFDMRFGGWLKAPDSAAPGMFPHYSAHDFVASPWRAYHFIPAAQLDLFRKAMDCQIKSALFPANYRYRKDPVTGAQYVACTIWGAPDYEINGENGGDIDYWQGLTLYGLYTYAKYSGNWQLLHDHWPVIRSLISYWESTHSWAFMCPAARESGEHIGGDMIAAGYDGLVGYYKLAQRLGTPYQKDLAAYLVSKAAVSMSVIFAYGNWYDRMAHQERRWGGEVIAGYGERYAVSIKMVNNETRDSTARDPWWMTGPIGPQGSQPELIDLMMERCPKQILHWEQVFHKMCPDQGFLTHDSGRVMPHLMLRTYLNDTMRQNAWECMARYKAYLLRDVHTVAGLLAWDVPVRLLDWSPATILSGRWDDKTQTATIQIKVEKEPATIQLTVKSDHFKILADRKPVATKQIDRWQDWKVVSFDLPPGTHQVEVK